MNWAVLNAEIRDSQVHLQVRNTHNNGSKWSGSIYFFNASTKHDLVTNVFTCMHLYADFDGVAKSKLSAS